MVFLNVKCTVSHKVSPCSLAPSYFFPQCVVSMLVLLVWLFLLGSPRRITKGSHSNKYPIICKIWLEIACQHSLKAGISLNKCMTFPPHYIFSNIYLQEKFSLSHTHLGESIYLFYKNRSHIIISCLFHNQSKCITLIKSVLLVQHFF